MKSTGIVRRVDKFGRVTLPIELRKLCGMEIGTKIEIYVEGDDIVLQKKEENHDRNL